MLGFSSGGKNSAALVLAKVLSNSAQDVQKSNRVLAHWSQSRKRRKAAKAAAARWALAAVLAFAADAAKRGAQWGWTGLEKCASRRFASWAFQTQGQLLAEEERRQIDLVLGERHSSAKKPGRL